MQTSTIADFVANNVNKIKKISPVSSSWESSEEEIKKGKPYILWYNDKNEIHKYLWKLADLAYKTAEKHKQDPNHHWTRWHLVRGLASCTFWWASAKDFSYIFGPYAWSPDEIERGINELIRSVRSLDDASTRKTKIKAEKLYIKIKQMVWEKHWTYYWKKIS